MCGAPTNDLAPEASGFHEKAAGRQWSKKFHRYLKHAEIANGEKGG
jgi:hypothetical protein